MFKNYWLQQYSWTCVIDWLIGLFFDLLIDWLIDPLIDSRIDWLSDCGIERSVDWLIDWLIIWLDFFSQVLSLDFQRFFQAIKLFMFIQLTVDFFYRKLRGVFDWLIGRHEFVRHPRQASNHYATRFPSMWCIFCSVYFFCLTIRNGANFISSFDYS